MKTLYLSALVALLRCCDPEPPPPPPPSACCEASCGARRCELACSDGHDDWQAQCLAGLP